MRKKMFITILAVIALAGISNAQDYKKFRVGLGIGFTITESMGLLYTIEPAYHLSNDLLLGLRFEGAGTALDTQGFTNMYRSYTVNVQYYLNDKRLKPFIGAGLGYYKLTLDEFGHDSKFGFYPRVGVDFLRMYLALDWNIMESTQAVDIDYTITNSYFGLRYGVFLGGGKK